MGEGYTMEKQEDIFDVTIVGGGPVGLFTTFYSGMRELKTKVIEYLPYLGGKVPYFYPEKIIRDVGGVKQASGEEFTKEMIEQAMTFDPTIVLGEQVVGLKKRQDGIFQLTSHNGEKHYTRTIILATGFGALKSVKLNLPNTEAFENQSLFYSINKLSECSGKRVLISGGGNSAVDWANELEPIAAKVMLVYRKKKFSGIESNITKMMHSTIEVLRPYELVNLKGKSGQLSSAVIRQVETGEMKELELDTLIVNHGFRIDLGPLAAWGMNMKDGMIKVDSSMSTSIPGIFAVGDIAAYPHKLSLIAGGFNEGPIAVNQVKQFISPDRPLAHLYSTHYDPLIGEDK